MKVHQPEYVVTESYSSTFEYRGVLFVPSVAKVLLPVIFPNLSTLGKIYSKGVPNEFDGYLLYLEYFFVVSLPVLEFERFESYERQQILVPLIV